MPERLSMLAQLRPATANTAALAYTVPAATQAVVSSVVVANTTGADTTFRLFVTTGTTYDASTALFYDVLITGFSTAVLTFGLALAAATKVAVAAGTASALTISIFGQELS